MKDYILNNIKGGKTMKIYLIYEHHFDVYQEPCDERCQITEWNGNYRAFKSLEDAKKSINSNWQLVNGTWKAERRNVNYYNDETSGYGYDYDNEDVWEEIIEIELT